VLVLVLVLVIDCGVMFLPHSMMVLFTMCFLHISPKMI